MPAPNELERYRIALTQQAVCSFPDWLRGKLDPADLVQQTLLEALRAPDRLAGRPDYEALAYLRRALGNNLTDAMRKHGRSRPDLDAAVASSGQLVEAVAGGHTSPSERAERNERFAKLAAALDGLPAAQRLAVELRYLQGHKVLDIARLMSRSEGAVSQLLNRALGALRDVLTGAA